MGDQLMEAEAHRAAVGMAEFLAVPGHPDRQTDTPVHQAAPSSSGVTARG